MRTLLLFLRYSAIVILMCQLAAAQRTPENAPPPRSKKPPAASVKKAAARAEEELKRNPELQARLQALVPPGTSIAEEAKGFRDLSSFVAAVHVANNLNIPLIELRALMQGAHPVSLAQAIHMLDPNVSSQYEENRAVAEARKDLEDTGEGSSSGRVVASRR